MTVWASPAIFHLTIRPLLLCRTSEQRPNQRDRPSTVTQSRRPSCALSPRFPVPTVPTTVAKNPDRWLCTLTNKPRLRNPRQPVAARNPLFHRAGNSSPELNFPFKNCSGIFNFLANQPFREMMCSNDIPGGVPPRPFLMVLQLLESENHRPIRLAKFFAP